jgi:hypothetical protein
VVIANFLIRQAEIHFELEELVKATRLVLLLKTQIRVPGRYTHEMQQQSMSKSHVARYAIESAKGLYQGLMSVLHLRAVLVGVVVVLELVHIHIIVVLQPLHDLMVSCESRA